MTTPEHQDVLAEYDIAHKQKAALGDQNALAVADRAIQTIRQDLTVRREEGKTMAEAIKAAERAYNSRVHSTVRDAPNDVASKTEAGRQLRFMAMTDSAAAYQHNQKLADKRVAKLKEQKSFRAPIEGGAFGRSFNASWSGKQELDKVQSGTLVKGKNSEQLRDVKSILVVPATTGAGSPEMRLACKQWRQQVTHTWKQRPAP